MELLGSNTRDFDHAVPYRGMSAAVCIWRGSQGTRCDNNSVPTTASSTILSGRRNATITRHALRFTAIDPIHAKKLSVSKLTHYNSTTSFIWVKPGAPYVVQQILRKLEQLPSGPSFSKL